MKGLLRILAFALMVGGAFAQSNLPVCQDIWNKCFGTVYKRNGGKYVGEFIDFKQDGYGTLYAFDGSIVNQGIWEKNKFIRTAPMPEAIKTNTETAQSDLPSCQGNFSSWNNCFGTSLDGTTGNKYVGEFRNGKFSGEGKMLYVFGSTYLGQWKNGNRHGQGVYEFANGDKYVGQYKDNRYEGEGTLYATNGSIINQGLWANGSFLRSAPVQQATLQNTELERLRAEAEEAKRKQAELEEQLRLAQQQARPITALTSSPMTNMANRRALVIGNDTYKSVAKLFNAREDARTMASNLTLVGYQVTLKLDLNEKEMKAAMRNFAGQVQGGDEVLFFFAGHGVQLGAANYLLPTDIAGDSEAQVRDEAIQLQRVLDDMSEKKAKFTLAMIDACRDNPFKSSGRAIGGRGLAPTTAATGQMVIFSAGTGQQALDKLNNADKNKNGLFTRVFVQEMQKPSQSIDRVVKNVRNQVAELAKSVGHEQVPAIYDQVLGDFYFKK